MALTTAVHGRRGSFGFVAALSVVLVGFFSGPASAAVDLSPSTNGAVRIAAPSASSTTKVPAGLRRAIEQTADRVAAGSPNIGVKVSFSHTGSVQFRTSDGAMWSLVPQAISHGSVSEPLRVSGTGRNESSNAENLGPLTAWYRTQEDGVEQGFSIPKAPEGDGDELAISLGSSGPFVPHVQSATTLELRGVGTASFSYSGLRVTDAKGQVLPAHFGVSKSTVRIEIDTAGAVYPLDVDPTVDYNTTQQLTGSAGEYLGAGVAVSANGEFAAVIPFYTQDEVLIYSYDGSSWSLLSTLDPGSYTVNGDAVSLLDGSQPAISADGTVIAFAASSSGFNATPDTNTNDVGVAVMYDPTADDGAWNTSGSNPPVLVGLTDPGLSDEIAGRGIAMAGDGGTVAVNDTGNSPGQIAVFTSSGGEDDWSATDAAAALLPTDSPATGIEAIALSDSGESLIAGNADTDELLTWNATSDDWGTPADVTSSSLSVSDPVSVAIDSAGDTAVVYANSCHVGYIYSVATPDDWTATGSGAPTEQAELVNGIPQSCASFNGSAISPNGEVVALGYSDSSGNDSELYGYVEPSGGWAADGTLGTAGPTFSYDTGSQTDNFGGTGQLSIGGTSNALAIMAGATGAGGSDGALDIWEDSVTEAAANFPAADYDSVYDGADGGYQLPTPTTGFAPYTYSATDLPSWATLNSSTGVITGTQTDGSSGTSGTFSVTVTDALGESTTNSGYTISYDAAISFSGTTLLGADNDSTYAGASLTAAEDGSGGGFTYSLLGAPSWLQLQGLDLVADGTNDVSGGTLGGTDATFSVLVDDTGDGSTTSVTFTVPVYDQLNALAGVSLLGADSNGNYQGDTISGTSNGGAGSYVYTLTGSFPTGLTVSNVGGNAVLGTGEITASANTYTFGIQTEDGNNVTVTSSNFTLVVSPQLVALTGGTTLPGADSDGTYQGDSDVGTSSGGSGSYVYTLTGSFPTGLTVSNSGGNAVLGTGEITASANTYTFGIQTEDGNNVTVTSSNFTLVVSPQLHALTATTLPGADSDGAYRGDTISGTSNGGAGSYVYTLTGSFPTGLTVSNSGGNAVLGTGEITASANTYTFGIQTEDGNNVTVTSSNFTLVVSPQLVALTAVTLLGADSNGNYQGDTISGTSNGGAGSYVYTLTGSFPTGLTVSNVGGNAVLGTGEITASANTYTFGIQTEDGNNVTVTSSNFTLVVSPQLVALTGGTTLPGADSDGTYQGDSDVGTSSGGSGSYVYTLTGSFPTGLTVSNSGGNAVLGTGEITASANTYTFGIQTEDGNNVTVTSSNFTLVVSPQLHALTATTLPGADSDGAYRGDTISGTSNGGAGSYVYTLTGSFPTGLTVSNSGGNAVLGTGEITASANTYTFGIQTEDGNNVTVTSSNFTLVVSPQLVALTAVTLLGADSNGNYQGDTISGTSNGGAGSYVYTLTGSFPTGLTVSNVGGNAVLGTGEITASANTYTFGIQTEDGNNVTVTSSNFTLVVSPQLVALTGGTTLPGADSDGTYQGDSDVGTSSGGSGSYVYTLTGSFPTGLTVSNSGGNAVLGTGEITASANTYTFGIQTEDGNNVTVTSSNFTLVVSPQLHALTATTLPGADSDGAYRGDTISGTSNGGAGSYVYTLTGSFPTGLTVSNSGGNAVLGTGEITASANTYTFGIQTEDGNNVTVTSSNFTLVVSPQLVALTAVTLPGADSNGNYQGDTISGTSNGGAGSYVYTLTGSFPTGLTVSNVGGNAVLGTGEITASANTYTFGIQTEDGNNVTVTSSNFTLVVSPQLVALTGGTTLPGADSDGTYQGDSDVGTSSGGSGSYVYTLTGSFPTGLTVSNSGGNAVLGTGEITASANTYTFGIQTEDGNNVTVTSSNFTLVVSPQLTLPSATLTPSDVGAAYAGASILASGGGGDDNYQITGGSLPTGLSMATSGAISGTPATGTGSPSGTQYSFTVTVTDANQVTANQGFSIDVYTGLAITTTSLPNADKGASYDSGNAVIDVVGGTGPYTITLLSGTLPTGLSLNSPGSGDLTGTPSTPGTYNFTIQAEDASDATTTASFSITIDPQLVALTAVTLLGADSNGNYQGDTISGTSNGGAGSYVYTLTGSFPTGLTVSNVGGNAVLGTGEITASANTYTFGIQTEDGNNVTVTSSNFTLVVSPQLVALTAVTLLGADSNGNYQGDTISGTSNGGAGSYVYTLTGSFPTGLTVSNVGGNAVLGTGEITASANTYTFGIQTEDGNNVTVTSSNFTLVVSPQLVAPIGGALVGGDNVQVYAGSSVSSGVTGGVTPYTYTLANSTTLPAGLSLTASTGAITGTPSGSTGTTDFAISVTDANDVTVTTANFSIAIDATLVGPSAVAFSPGDESNTYPGYALSGATGGSGTYTYSIVSPTNGLSGLTISSNGAVSGTPTVTTVGVAADFSITTEDANDVSVVTSGFSITVEPTLSFVAPTLKGYDAGETGYSSTAISVSGGSPSYTFSVASGSLPAGLSLSSTTGAVTGTPTSVGTSTFVIAATDANGVVVDSPTLSIGVSSALALSSATLSSATEGVSYSTSVIAAEGGSGSKTYSVTSGSLPGGLSLNTSTGLLSGIPTTSGSSTFTVTVSDANGAVVSQSFTLSVVSGSTVPAQPTVTAVARTAAGSVLVTWAAPSDGGSAITGYLITSIDSKTGASTQISVLASATSVTVTGLTEGDSYSFTVTAVNADGHGVAGTSNVVPIASAAVASQKTVTITTSTSKPVSLVSSSSGTSSSSNGVSTNETISATVSGTGTVSAATYSGDPLKGFAVTQAISSSSGITTQVTDYFDLNVAAGSKIKAITFKICNLSAGEEVEWYNPVSKKLTPVVQANGLGTPTAGADGCASVALSTKSSPTIAQLTGTIFAATKLIYASVPNGLLIVSAKGVVSALGGAKSYGSLSTTRAASFGAVAAIVPTSNAKGYLLVSKTGNVAAFGDMKSYGSIATIKTNASLPIVGAALTLDGKGYWLIGSDGSVYSFGDAKFYGSAANSLPSHDAIVSIVRSTDGKGYWLLSEDGRVFNFGDAKNYGNAAGNTNVAVSITATSDAKGYWITTEYGTVYAFGDAKSYGSATSISLPGIIVGSAATSSGKGYWMVSSTGEVYAFGNAQKYGSIAWASAETGMRVQAIN